MAPLMGRKIVIVGGSSGIGLGVAAAAVKAGAKVVVVGRSMERLKTARETLAAEDRVTALAADMTQEREIVRLFDVVGVFDHLVSTAGSPPPGNPIGHTDIDDVRDFIDNKFIGAVLLAKHAVRGLSRGGSMTFTSGINKDKPPVPGGAVVAAIAGSFSYLAHALSLELAPTRVNVVSPGWVDTPCSTHWPARRRRCISTVWPPVCPLVALQRRPISRLPIFTRWKAILPPARPFISMAARA